MKAIVIGAGRIGCGFAGQLLRDSGYEVVFVARNRALVDYFNQTGRYRVRLAQGSHVSEIIVNGVRAVCSADTACVAEEIDGADVVVTAVGADRLAEVAPLIAAGLRRRVAPLNILAFENLTDAGERLREFTATHLPSGFPIEAHGFSGALVSRAVTERGGGSTNADLLTFTGDTSFSFVVDRQSLRLPLPPIDGLIATDNYRAWIERKLYIFSAGHATCAYLGFIKGYHYIHTAIRDKEIRAAVLAAMREGQCGLRARYGRDLAGDENDLLEIIARFENAALNDPIERVGRDPRRKLSAGDRLLGAALLAESAGVRPEKLALAAAAALCFYNLADASATDLQNEIERLGMDRAFKRVSGLDTSRGLGRFIAEVWRRLAAGWKRGNLLLSLDHLLWAWQA